MPRRLFHIHQKCTGKNDYVGSLAAVFEIYSTKQVGISKGTLDRWDWETNPVYENENLTIRKDFLFSAGEVRVMKLPGLN